MYRSNTHTHLVGPPLCTIYSASRPIKPTDVEASGLCCWQVSMVLFLYPQFPRNLKLRLLSANGNPMAQWLAFVTFSDVPI